AHRQDEVRPSWREPSGARPRHGAGADHEPEPRLCRRPVHAAAQPARDARIAVRWHVAGSRRDGSSGVLLPGPSGSESRSARRHLSVRSLRAHARAAWNALRRELNVMANTVELYGCKGCGSAVVEALLAWAGVPYTYHEVEPWKPGPAVDALARINPLVQVPTLVLEDGAVVT